MLYARNAACATQIFLPSLSLSVPHSLSLHLYVCPLTSNNQMRVMHSNQIMYKLVKHKYIGPVRKINYNLFGLKMFPVTNVK